MALLSASVLLILLALRRLARTSPAGGAAHLLPLATLALAVTGAVGGLAAEAEWRQLRETTLGADAATIERLGRHIVAGYRSRDDIRRLIEARAIGGVFITARNVERRSRSDIAAEIASWQGMRRSQGLPPLIIATDQEGGDVSRMSPPLQRQPPLAVVIAKEHSPEGRRAAAFEYGRKQGIGLAELGVTLNFAPVVDLNFDVRSRADAHTRIWRRAISRDPTIVAEAAAAYCQGLADAGVGCTLKHFPGLGRLARDTHVAEARLDTPSEELSATDWKPFRDVPHPSSTLIMLGHVHLASIDADHPASLSRKVVTGLIRERWRHDGVLITDDLSMRAAYAGEPRWGLGAAGSAALAALNAGVDLILVSYDADQVLPVLSALLHAARDGRLDAAILAESDRRLARP